MGENYETEQKRGENIYFYPVGLAGMTGEGHVFGNRRQKLTFPMSTLRDLINELGDEHVS